MEKEKTTPEQNSEKEFDRQTAFVGRMLAKQKKVIIKIPIDPLNKKDLVVPVCINGYHYEIKRDERVEVPETVAEILENAQYI